MDTKSIDLCRECQESLRKFLHGEIGEIKVDNDLIANAAESITRALNNITIDHIFAYSTGYDKGRKDTLDNFSEFESFLQYGGFDENERKGIKLSWDRWKVIKEKMGLGV